MSLFNDSISPVMIAVFHSIFNIATTIILLPFSNTLVKIAKKLVTTDNADGQVVLDERLLLSPGLAVKECLEKTNEMAELARDSFKNALDLFDNYSDSKFDDIEVMEERLDYLEDQLDTFLIHLSGKDVSEAATTRFQRCFMQSMTSRESEIMR
ncbi:MAG: PhoU domain-containing protein [Agathobacter rectalis]